MPRRRMTAAGRRYAGSPHTGRAGFSRAAAPPPAVRRVARTARLGVIAAATLIAATSVGAGAATETLRLRCTNPTSGANWPVVVDLVREQVDSLPATITEQWISWHDPKLGYFDLERPTGSLRLRNASSTGGYFLYYRCRPD